MIRRAGILLVTGVLSLAAAWSVRAQDASVKAVVFYNPNCGACRTLLNETLPPLVKQYGSSLLLFTVDVTNPEGGQLYQAALTALSVPQGQRAVPMVILEDTCLAGLPAIESQFQVLIDEKLARGGTAWPSIPGLETALREAGFIPTVPNPWERFLAGQPANSFAVVVLLFLFLSLVFTILITFRPAPKFMETIPVWVFPLLLVVGLIVASYLTYTELTQTEVFCGGISNCTAVQNSPYSKILGVITVGEFGILGYCLVGLAWLVHRVSRGRLRAAAAAAMFGFAVFGVSFSIYLTFLEPFVIGATCLWCLTSAIIMGLVLPLTSGPVRSIIPPSPPYPAGSASRG